MNRKNIPALLLLFSCVCSHILALQLKVTYASEYRMIDLFAQRGGKGLNQPSDAFVPQEEVILYANLTYRDDAVANKLVAFQIYGPVNPLNNITFSRTATTNASGIATIDFRIPWPTENPETIVLGTWKAYARADIAEVRVEDTLVFEVIIVPELTIDLYSDKPDPYSGKGLNVPCDAFEPQEGITLYAAVTYNDDPVASKLVSFEIRGPQNKYQNLTFWRAAATDDDGVACVEFRVPWPAEHAEEIVMGDWTTYARVSVAEMIANDTMPFKVGWLVELISLETGEFHNSALVPKNSFKKGECVGFKLVVENIGFTEKTADFSIVVYDDLGVPIAQYKVRSYTVPSGSKTIELWCYLSVPKWAFLGVGTVYTNAFKSDLSGVPYCPEISVTIKIVKT